MARHSPEVVTAMRRTIGRPWRSRQCSGSDTRAMQRLGISLSLDQSSAYGKQPPLTARARPGQPPIDVAPHEPPPSLTRHAEKLTTHIPVPEALCVEDMYG